MDAMILAAGLGTRLRPITDHIPKALVPVAGVPMLERVARRLIAAGADRLVINAHHHADQIRTFVRSRDDFGVDVRFSLEPERPLDTGGGLLHATSLFRREAPFFLHNVDVVTDVDLTALYQDHRQSGAVASLVVRRSESDRYLLFNGDGLFCGYGSTHGGDTTRPGCGDYALRRCDFLGIHVIDPELLDRITERGVFSIIYLYARLAALGETVREWDAGSAWWVDIGTPDRLETARAHLAGQK